MESRAQGPIRPMLISSEVVVRIQDLRKTFRVGFWGRPIVALDGVDMEIRRGEVFGFLGPNGAGKTTTIKILIGLMYPTAGTVSIFSRPVSDAGTRSQIGFLSDTPRFYDYLTIEENLMLLGRLFNLSREALSARIDELLLMMGLCELKNVKLRKLSKGMMQRVGLAQALINDPKLLILDEPMSGLDPYGRRMFRDVVLRLKGEGKTILFSTQVLDDIECLCDRIGILRKGRLVVASDVEQLASFSINASIEMVIGGLDLLGIAEVNKLTCRIAPLGYRTVLVLQTQQQVNEVLEVIRRRRATLLSLTRETIPLEVFQQPDQAA